VRRFSPQWLHLITGPYYNARSHFDLAGRDPSTPYPEDGKESGISLAEKAYEECANAGLRVSALSALNLKEAIKTGDTLGTIVDMWQDLSRRVSDELSCEYFLQLNTAEANRYDNWRNGWEGIIARFGGTSRDVEEMNKCFALGRYTAAMFHALQVAEWGAIELGTFLCVSDPKKGWGATERKLRELLKNGHEASLPPGCKFEFLEQMHREIDSMVLAWRHKVDHAANPLAILPNTDFAPDVAEHIIGAVRIFMLRLLEGLPAEFI